MLSSEIRARPTWRRCRSSTERGCMWLMLMSSPVSGSAISSSSGILVLQVVVGGDGVGAALAASGARRRSRPARRPARSPGSWPSGRSGSPVRSAEARWASVAVRRSRRRWTTSQSTTRAPLTPCPGWDSNPHDIARVLFGGRSTGDAPDGRSGHRGEELFATAHVGDGPDRAVEGERTVQLVLGVAAASLGGEALGGDQS